MYKCLFFVFILFTNLYSVVDIIPDEENINKETKL